MEFKDVVQEVKAQLEIKINYLISKGIKEWQISIDPGLGFGKTMRDSEILFKNLDVLCFDFPLVVGYSKKKFTYIELILNIPLKENFFLYTH